MSNQPTFDDRFVEYREYLESEISRLACYVEVFKQLKRARTDHLDELNFAPAFFGTVEDALFTAIVIWVHKLYDEKGQRGLHDFLKFVELHRKDLSARELKRRGTGGLPPIESRIVEHRERIEGLAGFLASIDTRRDKFHAHFDKSHFFRRERFATEAPIRWDELDEATKLAWDILNTYSGAFDGTTVWGAPMNIGDLDIVLEALREA